MTEKVQQVQQNTYDRKTMRNTIPDTLITTKEKSKDEKRTKIFPKKRLPNRSEGENNERKC